MAGPARFSFTKRSDLPIVPGRNWRNIALRNAALSNRQLNYAVQITIDRIVFLRICEDRGIERYGQLMGLLNGPDIYPRLMAVFRRADDRYNSGLFHFLPEKDRPEGPDELTPELVIDDKPLKEILRSLYYPDCPYEFSVLPAEILGEVYEQFLGKVITLTAGHHARIEDKPEVKKAGGVYYTPAYIVDYIVEHTVGKLLEDASVKRLKTKPPRLDRSLRVLDPACGSGSFLLGAYQTLLDWYRDYYENHEPREWTTIKHPPIYQAGRLGWKLTLAERKRILLDHIYGVDIDTQAVEVTKLSLLLRVLEGEKDLVLFHNERALPDLAGNIKCGNSLIGPDFYQGKQLAMFDEDERLRINAFDWKAEFPQVFQDGGFDAVIGNPPYGMVNDEDAKEYFEHCFEATEGRFDTYELFIEKGISLCRNQGLFGYIIPSPVLSNLYARRLRRYMLENVAICEITNFGMDVFPDPTIHTCIIVLARDKAIGHKVMVRKQVKNECELAGGYDYALAQSKLGSSSGQTFDIFIDPAARRLLEKMTDSASTLGEICFIRQCIKTGNDYEYVCTSKTKLPEPWKPTLRGRSVGRYVTHERDLYLKYGPWLARNWKNRSFYETVKIAVRETGRRITASLDFEHRYFLSSLYAVYPRSPRDLVLLKYILGILNSRLSTWFMKIIALDLTQGAFTKVRTNQLARLPIRCVDDLEVARRHHEPRMVELVDSMLQLHKDLVSAKTPGEKNALQRQIDATDKEIDRLVYELYGLTGDEIRIVEEATQG